MRIDPEFWKDRQVLLTGHTGFKGVWMALCLNELGAHVTGIALAPKTEPSLYRLAEPWSGLESHFVDIRDAADIKKIVDEASPDIVIHMAAQTLVRRSYREPVGTMTTNILGTINLLEALRNNPDVSAVLVVTSDKVYRNDDDGMSFQESAHLGGDDPYSASKAATEIVTESWARSFFDKAQIPVITARAGNVIGGGDFSEDRIVPDVWRAKQAGEAIVLRFPNATRPWQHVLDLNAGYLAYIEATLKNDWRVLPSSLNFGPINDEVMTVKTIAEKTLEALGAPGRIQVMPSDLAEKALLSIDTGLAQQTIGWCPQLTMADTIDWTAEWYRDFDAGKNPRALTVDQINRYLN